MIQNNAYLIAGIAEAITCDDKVFLLEGDRHHWPNNLKEEWEEQWWFEAPFQVITVKEKLSFLGRVYSNIQQAEYILDFCIQKKGWIPKIFFPTEHEAKTVKENKEYACSIDKPVSYTHLRAHET